mmetsp:Transcript_35870/g.114025  ORF Transcript_35870/g.114025 Transcript_35870/m.114025 type:complete len:212 (+) Transcript_35870:264-899(+)
MDLLCGISREASSGSLGSGCVASSSSSSTWSATRSSTAVGSLELPRKTLSSLLCVSVQLSESRFASFRASAAMKISARSSAVCTRFVRRTLATSKTSAAPGQPSKTCKKASLSMVCMAMRAWPPKEPKVSSWNSSARRTSSSLHHETMPQKFRLVRLASLRVPMFATTEPLGTSLAEEPMMSRCCQLRREGCMLRSSARSASRARRSAARS